MSEFEVSRAQQIARELWGKNEATYEMQTADVYQKLARGIVYASVEVRAKRIIGNQLIDAYEAEPDLTLGVLREVETYIPDYTHLALDGIAYKIGYDAHITDGTAKAEADRYAKLDEMTRVYRALES